MYVLQLLCQCIRREYVGYMEDKQSMMLEFEGDVITLDLPDSPPQVVVGWKILPLTCPKACVQLW